MLTLNFSSYFDLDLAKCGEISEDGGESGNIHYL